MEEGEPGIYCGIFSFIVCGGGIYDVCLFRVGIYYTTYSKSSCYLTQILFTRSFFLRKTLLKKSSLELKLEFFILIGLWT